MVRMASYANSRVELGTSVFSSEQVVIFTPA